LPCGSSSADGWREVTAPQQKQRASRHPAAEQLGDSEFSSRCFPFNAAARAFGSEAVVEIALRTTAPCCSESTAYPGPGCLPHGKAPQALDVMARNIFGGVEVGLRVCLHDWQGLVPEHDGWGTTFALSDTAMRGQPGRTRPDRLRPVSLESCHERAKQ
jgi:hypothetical protein